MNNLDSWGDITGAATALRTIELYFGERAYRTLRDESPALVSLMESAIGGAEIGEEEIIRLVSGSDPFINHHGLRLAIRYIRFMISEGKSEHLVEVVS